MGHGNSQGIRVKVTLKDMWKRDKTGFFWFGCCMAAAIGATIQRDYFIVPVFVVCGLLFAVLSRWLVKTRMIHEEIRRRDDLIMSRWFSEKYQNDPRDS